ncbi:MAG: AMP-binding protein [Rhizobiales bacterium]|nr:AMP-binding protein [Hyphomicrobiales bacterium]
MTELQAAFWDSIGSAGNRPALIDGATGGALSHSGLAARVEDMARMLGTTATKRLALLLVRNNATSIATYMALLRLGDAVLPVAQDMGSLVMTALVTAYQPDLVIGQFPDGAPLDWANLYTPEQAVDGLTVLRRIAPAEQIPHADLAMLLTTSGSTGSPKGVRLSYGALAANARQIATALRMGPDDRAMTTLSMAYSFGLSVLNSHILAGGSLVLTEHSPLEPAFWQAAAQAEATTLPGVPFTYDLLRRIGAPKLVPVSMKKLLQAGGAMTPQMVQWTRQSFGSLGLQLFVMYGQTEATARMTVLPPEDAEAGDGSVGSAVPEGQLEIDGDGQIIYRGPNVMMGYAVNRDDLTRGDECGGVLYTGDLGRLDEAGRLWIVGRAKRIAKLFGMRLSLDDMETALQGLGELAIGGDDTAILVAVESGDLDQIRLRVQALASEMKLPASVLRVRAVEKLPRSANGKILYSQLETAPLRATAP